jgi:hypothetical protein
MKVTSKKEIFFNKLNWGIMKGEVKELPADKDAQAIILAHPSISLADKTAGHSTAEKNK